MIHVMNKETRALDICLKKGVSGARVVLLPGLNDVEDNAWKQALTQKWTAKLFGRRAIEGPKELDGVKLFVIEAPKPAKAAEVAKVAKKSAPKGKKPETESFD